jgi:hypothetical protein
VAADALVGLRAAARARAVVLGPPDQRLEDWRYVRCRSLATAGDTAGTAPAIPLPPDGGPALALGDGALGAAHGPWPAAWRLALPDAAAVAAMQAELDAEDDPAACWAVADAACVQRLAVAGDADAPLALLDAAGGGRSGWRLDLLLAPGARLRLRIVHAHAPAARAASWIAAELGEGARLEVDELWTAPCGVSLSLARCRLAGGASLAWTSAGAGGALQRARLAVELCGPRAEAELAAVDAPRGDDQAHRHWRVRHAARDATSAQLAKAALRDRSLHSFDGLVTVAQGADGTRAGQQSRSLLLSPAARADARPQLDVRADEVEAAHGSTIGRPDAEELAYLRLRGLDAAEAAGLLARGFVDEVLGRMRDPWLRGLAGGVVEGGA